MAQDTPQVAGSLGDWIAGVLFVEAKANREALETKWTRNRAAFLRDPALDTGKTWKKSEASKAWQSDTMPGMTKSKATQGYCVVKDMLFKGGRVAFMLQPDPGGPPQLPQQAAEPPAGEVGEARDDTINRYEQRLRSHLDSIHAIEELSNCILSSAIYGQCYAKRFVLERTEPQWVQIEGGLWEQREETRQALGLEAKSVWNMYRDMEAPTLAQSAYVMERDFIGAYELRSELGKPFFIDAEIEGLLAQETANIEATGSGTTEDQGVAPNLRELKKRRRKLQRIEFWGRVPAAKVRSMLARLEEIHKAAAAEAGEAAEPFAAEDWAAGGPALEQEDLPGEEIECSAIVVGSRVIRFALTDPKDRPYYEGFWEKVVDYQGGVGVADNVEPDQRTLTGSVRALEDSAKLLSNLILAAKRRLIKGDLKELFTGMVLDIDEDAGSIADVLSQLKLDPAVIEPLLKVIEMFMGFGDLDSMIPRAEQGQQEMTPQTAFELQQRLERAGKYMADVIGNHDKLTEAFLTDCYNFDMGNPDLQDKGRYKIKALGFSSFENRVIRLQRLMATLTMILSDETLKSMSKIRYLYEEVLKGQDLEPDQVIMTPAEMQAEAQSRMAQMEQSAAGGPAGPEANALAMEKERATITRLLAESRDKDAAAVLKRTEAVTRRVEAVRAATEDAGPIEGGEAGAGRRVTPTAARPLPAGP